MKIRYFAWLREQIGTAGEEVALPAGVDTVRELIAWLQRRSKAHEAAFARSALIRCAIDHEFVGQDAPLAAAREVGFFPPVTGG